MRKILVANRGEIAVRVMATARDLGYRTVAIYSEADTGALHVDMADEAVCIGPAVATESYLSIEKIIDAAQRTGADAIHPGYGFLSENYAFAEACSDVGITFIGPSVDAIKLMGSKRLSKVAMIEAGVPCIPGYEGADQSDETLLAEAEKIGFPLMVKASAGGGGKGMRLVHERNRLEASIITARSEAEKAFGSGELILERAVIEPRHIEIQVFADTHGNIVHLGERDCSIQRRHQKVVEEAPSPFVDQDLRDRMGAAAVEAARSCDYRGAGTVEFLVDAERNFYFLEMNTRLQVEHPVTECITGLDLVEWQLLVAEGDALPRTQDEIKLSGHAIEVRLYAEDPRADFMPQTGVIANWSVPKHSGTRVDHGVKAGQVISAFYDPMLAKMIAYGPNRATALRRLSSLCADTGLLGVNNNKAFLGEVLRHSTFEAGGATTAFVEQFLAEQKQTKAPSASTLARGALLFFTQGKATGTASNGWRSGSSNTATILLMFQVQKFPVRISVQYGAYLLECGDERVQLELSSVDAASCVFIEGGIRRSVTFAFDGDILFLDDGTGHYAFLDATHLPAASDASAGDGSIKAPMDGAVIRVLAAQGETVSAGQTLIVMEAMKMEHSLKAPIDGRVSEVSVSVGDQVKSRSVLAVVSLNDAKEE
jgi:geranyl-CoA carboxylase alpha subunit